MAEHTLKTRIQLKYDTYENWIANDPILKTGEIAIATLASAGETGFQNIPNVVLKAGDGTSKYSELKFVSALAADVSAWAKAPTKPTYQASEIQNLKEYISGQIQDTNTTYQLTKVNEYQYKLQSKEKNADEWTDVSTIDIPNDTEAINALKALVGETAVAEQINTAIAALAVTDTETTGQFVTAVAQSNGKVSITRRALTAGDIPELEMAKITGLTAALAAKQDTITFNSPYDSETNKAATMADITNAVGGLSGAMHFEGVKASVPEENDEYASGDVILVGNKEYVFDGSAWHELGDETIYAVKGNIKNADIAEDAAIAMTKIAGLNDALGAKLDSTTAASTYEPIGAETRAKTYADTKVAALDATDAAVEKQFVTAVSQTDGVISVTRAALKATDIPTIEQSQVNGLTDALNQKANNSELHAIAKSGNVNDLVQNPEDILILDCGTSNTVI